jgi:hypothetical protein
VGVRSWLQHTRNGRAQRCPYIIAGYGRRAAGVRMDTTCRDEWAWRMPPDRVGAAQARSLFCRPVGAVASQGLQGWTALAAGMDGLTAGLDGSLCSVPHGARPCCAHTGAPRNMRASPGKHGDRQEPGDRHACADSRCRTDDAGSSTLSREKNLISLVQCECASTTENLTRLHRHAADRAAQGRTKLQTPTWPELGPVSFR